MTANPERVPSFSFEDAERAQLLAWMGLSAGAKIDFFEEMIGLAYHSGALSSEQATRQRHDFDDRRMWQYPRRKKSCIQFPLFLGVNKESKE